jgi:hypothetical protein
MIQISQQITLDGCVTWLKQLKLLPTFDDSGERNMIDSLFSSSAYISIEALIASLEYKMSVNL